VFFRCVKSTASRFYNRFTRLNAAPREIALGFSLGIMIGMTPFFGLHIIACVSLAAILGWSKIAAFVGCQITNVFTAPVIYFFNYWVGLNLVGLSKDVNWTLVSDYEELFELMRQSPQILADLFVGGMIVGTPLVVVSYFAVHRIVQFCRNRTSVCASDPSSR
jgi:uncharacterized protein (DUF2062 family)